MVGSVDDVHDHGLSVVENDAVGGGPVLQAAEGILEGTRARRAALKAGADIRVVDVLL